MRQNLNCRPHDSATDRNQSTALRRRAVFRGDRPAAAQPCSSGTDLRSRARYKVDAAAIGLTLTANAHVLIDDFSDGDVDQADLGALLAHYGDDCGNP